MYNYFYIIFDQINTALVSRRDPFQNFHIFIYNYNYNRLIIMFYDHEKQLLKIAKEKNQLPAKQLH